MSAPNTSAQFVQTYPDIRMGTVGGFVVGFRNSHQSADFRDIEHPVEKDCTLVMLHPREALDCVHAADEAWRGFLKRRQRRGGVAA